MKKLSILVLMVMIAVIGSACQKEPKVESEKQVTQEVNVSTHPELIVELLDQEGVVVGEAMLKERDQGVEIIVEASHLPEGLHGFHIHEKGVCEPPSFKSAGGHFNLDDQAHGFDNPDGPHIGDLRNLEVQADGTVNETFFNEHVTLKPGAKNSLLSEAGTSLVIHSGPDDYKSQPAGDAGERIACGVIAK